VVRIEVPLLSGRRFSVVYGIRGNREAARQKAEDICYEQTVEFPDDLTPPGDIEDYIVGKIEDFEGLGEGYFRTVISYAVETAGRDIVQFLNVVFGNISIKPGIKVERLLLPEDMLKNFIGPRFGREGLRRRLRISHRPFICTALKPMGLSASELAEKAYRFARGGIDIIKDDHGLADQVFSPFSERVKRCSEAVAKANAETGGSTIYMPNITAPYDRIRDRCETALREGAGGFLICPGLCGIDTLRYVTACDEFDVPVIAHPAFSGSFVTSAENGLSHYVLYGQLMRLAGADATIFPNYGGRFSFRKEECIEIVRGCSDSMGRLLPIMPAPGGGMTTDRAGDMLDVYGRDFIILMGGGLHRHGSDLEAASRYFLEMLESF